MRYQFFTSIVFMLGLSANATGAPSVVTDIAPLHSLTSQVMEGVGKPTLLIPAEASPHHYSLRPSEAKALAGADLVFWMGKSYTPWLEKAMHNVADSAQKVGMLALEDTITYGYREGTTFESHDHAEEEHHDAGHHGGDHHKEGHHDDKQAKHGDHDHHMDAHHDDHHKGGHHDEHKEDHHGKHEDGEHTDHHDHEGIDPHAWLDPENAKRWVQHMTDVLSKSDPDNALTYSRNAEKTIASLDALIQSTATKVDALNEPKFIVFHDAYQYFEKRFGVAATGSISLGHAQAPSPARIKEIRGTVKKLGVTCVFTEPQYNAGMVNAVFEGSTVSTIGVMDPLGARISEGADHYQALIEGMVNSLSECQ